uniref:Gustatory receptor n=1 Tax=Tetranychus urticae TaxID=32264 RepID=T1JTN8_TETUR
MVESNLKKLFTVNVWANLLRLVNLQNNSEIETVEAIRSFDKIFRRWSSCRGGLQQTLDKPINIKFHIYNWFFRFNVFIIISRFIVFILIDNYYCDLCLANPFGETKGAKKNALMLCIIFISMFLYGFRDYPLQLEETGRMKVIRILYLLEKRGFNAEILNMSNLRCEQFRKWCDTILVGIFFAIITLQMIALFFLIYLRISLVYSNGSQFIIPRTLLHYIFHLIFIIIEIFTFFVFVINAMCTSAYILVILTFFILRLNTLIDLIKRLSLKSSLNNSILSELNYRLIEVLNDFGQWNGDSKYLFQYAIIASSAIANFFCFVGFLYDLEPDATTMSISIVGIFVHILVSIGCYLGAEFHYESIKMRKLFCNLYCKLTKNATTQVRLKSMEIVDRLDSRCIGAHVGDFGILYRSTCIIVLLENASFIMLLSCNVR